jgi:hypothetical protein
MRIKNLESPKIKQFEICFPYNNYVTVDYSLKYDRYLCINSEVNTNIQYQYLHAHDKRMDVTQLKHNKEGERGD